MASQEAQSSNLTDEQHFFPGTTVFLSVPPQKCSRYSKYQWQVYTEGMQAQDKDLDNKSAKASVRPRRKINAGPDTVT